jgi:hypothetical protein
MTGTVIGRPVLPTLCVVVAAMLLSSCVDRVDGEVSAADIPGLDPSEEIALVEVEPSASDGAFIWSRAYEVEGLPPVNVGHVTPEFLEDAHRQDDDPEAYQCLGDASGSSSCGVEDDVRPVISGLTFGGVEVEAWSWQFVPVDAVAIRYTDGDGQSFWQRPQDRLVIFPVTVAGDSDVHCSCRLDAIDIDGGVIVSVDGESSSYMDD